MRILNLMAWFLFFVFCFSACETVDYTGFFYSPDRADKRFNESMAWNREHPFRQLELNTDAYQLFVFGDSHLGTHRNFSEFLDTGLLAPTNAAFVMVGDLVSGHEYDYQHFVDLLPSQDIKPSFLMIGNHDLFFEGWDSFRKHFGTSVFLFTVKTPKAADLYICLDSGSGTIGNLQLAWLKQVLAIERSKYRHCMVFTHVNFFRDRHTSSTNPLIEEMNVLMDLFARYRVDYVVSGHDHKRFVDYFGNTCYLTMDGLLDTLPTASFLILNIDSTNLSHNFIPLNVQP